MRDLRKKMLRPNEAKNLILEIIVKECPNEGDYIQVKLIANKLKNDLTLNECHYLCENIANDEHIKFDDESTFDGVDARIEPTNARFFLLEGGYSIKNISAKDLLKRKK